MSIPGGMVAVLLVAGASEPEPVVICLRTFVAAGLDGGEANRTQGTIVRVLTNLGVRVISPARDGGACGNGTISAMDATARPRAPRGILEIRVIRAGPLVLLTARMLGPDNARELVVRTWQAPVESLLAGESLRTELASVLAVLAPTNDEAEPGAASAPGQTSDESVRDAGSDSAPAGVPPAKTKQGVGDREYTAAAVEPDGRAALDEEVLVAPREATHIASWVLAGVAGIGIAAGVTFGVLARGELKYRRVDPRYPEGRRSAKTYVVLADVSYGIAGAAAVTSVALFFVDFGSGDGGKPLALVPFIGPAGAGVVLDCSF